MCVCDVFLVSALTDGIKGATHQQSPAHKNRKAGRQARQLLPAAFVDDNTISTDVELHKRGGNKLGFEEYLKHVGKEHKT